MKEAGTIPGVARSKRAVTVLLLFHWQDRLEEKSSGIVQEINMLG